MNNMKHMIHSKFTNLGGKLRLDKNSNSDTLALPPYAESLYNSSKNDKDVYNEFYKKLSTICVQNYSVTDDKKMKKNSWESLSNLISESERKLSDDTLTKEIFASSISVLDELAQNTKEFEKGLSSNVIKHFHDLSEDNTLTNTKKALTSLSKDMKANSDKVQVLQDQLNVPTNDTVSYRKSVDISSMTSVETKLASAQINEENTEKEWESKKDLYLTKLFVAQAEKFTTAEKILELFQDYHDYYSECQKSLSKLIPYIRAELDKKRNIYAFHVPLEEHLSATNRKLSFVLETCIQELDNEDTLQHEGLFRISGGKNKMELLKSALNVMRVDECITKGCDSAVYAGVLKQYLRELPDPLMTYDLYDKWCEVGVRIRQNDIDGAMSLIKACLKQIPPDYYYNLAYLMQFLKKITAYESINKMSASNIGLVMGPNLIRNRGTSVHEDSEASAMRMLASPGGSVLEFMIAHFTELFPDAPVYTTAPRISAKVTDISSNASLNEKESDKTVKKSKYQNDSDSLSSGDLLVEENLLTTGPESDNQRSDSLVKSLRDGHAKPRSFRKAPAPPPPPQIKPYMIDNETDSLKELGSLHSENRPQIKKRTSILEKQAHIPAKEETIVTTTAHSDTKPGKCISPRSTVMPIIPSKKPDINAHSESIEKPIRPDNPPPKRPNIPPPPIPPFEKLKENLEHKQVITKPLATERKQSFQETTTTTKTTVPASVDSSELLSPKTTALKHKYSSSDVSHTTF